MSTQKKSKATYSLKGVNYTITSEGYIPSYNYKDLIQCPVKVMPERRNSDKFPNPVRNAEGRLIFMLPGGIEIAPKDAGHRIVAFEESNGNERRAY